MCPGRVVEAKLVIPDLMRDVEQMEFVCRLEVLTLRSNLSAALSVVNRRA